MYGSMMVSPDHLRSPERSSQENSYEEEKEPSAGDRIKGEGSMRLRPALVAVERVNLSRRPG